MNDSTIAEAAKLADQGGEDLVAQDKTNSRSALQSQARQAATTALIDAHRDEFNKLMEQECSKRGIRWNRKLTKAERAKAELDKLLAANPELVAQLQVEAQASRA